MNLSRNLNHCERGELTDACALQVLPPSEVAVTEAHISACPDCQRELESLRPVVDRFVFWPTDVLRPTMPLQARLAHRIAEETGKPPVLPQGRQRPEPDALRLSRERAARGDPRPHGQCRVRSARDEPPSLRGAAQPRGSA